MLISLIHPVTRSYSPKNECYGCKGKLSRSFGSVANVKGGENIHDAITSPRKHGIYSK